MRIVIGVGHATLQDVEKGLLKNNYVRRMPKHFGIGYGQCHHTLQLDIVRVQCTG